MPAPHTRPNTQAVAAWPHRRFLASRTRLARLPGGLLGMIALVVAVERGVVRQGAALMDPPCFSWAFSAAGATGGAVGAETLCLGDSLAKHALIPAVLEAGTGRRAYNAAAAAAPSPWTYFVLRRALAAGARPRTLIFDLKPSLLTGGPHYALRYYQECLTPRETWELLRAGKGRSYLAPLLLGQLLPSFRARHEIRGSIREALEGLPGRLASLNALCLRNWTVNAGANVARRHPEFTGEVPEKVHRDLLSDRFATHKTNAAFARKLVDLARKEGITTYLVIPPYSPGLRQRRERSGADARYDTFVRSLQARDPALTVLDARAAAYPFDVFVDPTHLDRQGALTLSTDVAAVLREDQRNSEARPKGRWVALPGYREVVSALTLEDVEQSRLRLQAERDH